VRGDKRPVYKHKFGMKPKTKPQKKNKPKAKKREVQPMKGMVVVEKPRASRPRVLSKSDGKTLIMHKELMIDLQAANDTFNVDTFILNPAREEVFNWLSTIAHGWEYYRFHKVKVRFVPRAPTTSIGDVSIFYEPNAAHGVPTTIQDVAGFEKSVSGHVSSKLEMTIPSHMLNKEVDEKPVKTSFSQTVGVGSRLEDSGKIYVISEVSGFPTAAPGLNNLGRLWLEYAVELSSPTSESDDPGGEMALSGDQANFASVSQTLYGTSKGMEWKYVLGIFNGPIMDRAGLYMYYIKVTILGGGSITGWNISLKNYGHTSLDAASWVRVMTTTTGVTGTALVFANLASPSDVVDFDITDTGTITGVGSFLYCARAPVGSISPA